MPAEVLGLNGVPTAGDIFKVLDDEKVARGHRGGEGTRADERGGALAGDRWTISSSRSRQARSRS